MKPTPQTSTPPNARGHGLTTRAKRIIIASAAGLAFAAAVASNIEQLVKLAGQLIPSLAKTPSLLIDADASALARPLDGYGVRHLSNRKTVFLEGLQLIIPIRHDRSSAQTIIVDQIRMHVDSFTPGNDPRLSYRTKVDEVPGAGPAKPNIFRVIVAGTEVTGVSWVLEDGTIAKQTVPSSNILDIEPPTYFEFQNSNGDDAELLVGYVLPSITGRYIVRLTLSYATGDGSTHAIEIGPFDIYHE